MKKIHVIWHKIPDTDATISSIIFAEYLKSKWEIAHPYKLGNINNETRFVLDYVWVEEPETLSQLEKGSTVALVDHNEQTQTIENIADLEIHSIVDHHKIGNLATEYPLFIRTEKLCSTASVLYKMMKAEWLKPNKEHATLIISAIISDSLHFRSGTTQNEDKFIVEELNEIANIPNIEEFAMSMFAAKSDLGDISVEELIKIDYKEFDLNGKKAWIGTIETTNPNYSFGRKDEILTWLEKIKNNDWLDFILLSIVDIIGENNKTIISWDKEKNIVKEVFWVETVDNIADLGNRLSRKKDIVPQLTAYFK